MNPPLPRSEHEIHSEIAYKTAVCCLVKGRQLPAFLATLDLRSRIVAVTAIDSFMPRPMSEDLFTTLVTDPAVMMDAMLPSTAIILENMACMAQREIARWSPEDLERTTMDAGHWVADIIASRAADG